MSSKGYYNFEAKSPEKERSVVYDVRAALPKMFDLIETKDGFCSNPEQVVGIFSKNRVFGGQTFTQFCMMAKRLAEGKAIKRLDIIFCSAGDASLPIHYKKHLISFSTGFLAMKAFQNDKLIACAVARPFDFVPRMASTIPKPLECKTLREIEAQTNLGDWIEKFGNSLNITSLGPTSELFELRPIDFNMFAGLNSKVQTMQCWVRLTPDLQGIKLKEPLFVPMTVCDYLAGQPLLIALDQHRLHYKSGASITHKVCIHRSTGFDPKGFFLIENTLEAMSPAGTGMFNGRVFDEAGQCILSFSQMNYNRIGADDASAKQRAKL